MLRAVLLPTDFSENAFHAIKYALDLFKCDHTNFYFLHTYADEVYDKAHSETKEVLEKLKLKMKLQAEDALKVQIQKAQELHQNPKHHFEAIALFDPLVDGINDFVNQVNIDLIVMGTKGMSADKNRAFGSHTVQVFKYVQCPVLAIPENYDYKVPKKILFPTDFMLPFKRRELKFLNEITGSFKSEIQLLYLTKYTRLSHRQEDNKLFLRASLSKAFLTFECFEGENRVKAILDYIATHKTDMLVMVNSRHSFMEEMLYRSTVEQIGLTINIPFLVMQNLPR